MNLNEAQRQGVKELCSVINDKKYDSVALTDALLIIGTACGLSTFDDTQVTELGLNVGNAVAYYYEDGDGDCIWIF